MKGEECGMHSIFEKWIKISDKKDHWRVRRLHGKILLKYILKIGRRYVTSIHRWVRVKPTDCCFSKIREFCDHLANY